MGNQLQQTPLEQQLLARTAEPVAPAEPAEPVDPTIQRAIDLIPEEFRPTVPVRFYEDPKKLYEQVLKPLHDPELSPNAVGVVPADKKSIYINRKSKEFEDLYKLASKLAHEQYHVTQNYHDRHEAPAYERELAVVNKYPGNFPLQYRRDLETILQRFRNKEQKKK